MPRKKQTEQPAAQPQDKLGQRITDTLAALGAVFDVIPKAKFGQVFADANCLESNLRTGLRGLRLLYGIRQYILDTPSLGGEESPFVQQIDKLIERD